MSTHQDAGIVVDDLSFRYPGSDEYVLQGASVEIDDGEFVAVVGGNGSGKTTLCKSFNGLIPHFYEGSFDGEVTVAGRETSDATVSQLSERVGYVFQEFDNQLVSPTVADEVAFGPINHGHDDYRERVARALSLVGLDGLEDRFLWELSGGQRHLVALAAVLSLDPAVLVVDEPAAQLDPVHAEEAYDHLAALNRHKGKTVVTIEHRTEFVAEYCDSVVLVEDGRVAWKAPVETALNRLDDLRANGVHPPQVTRVAERLCDDGGQLPVRLQGAVRRFESRLEPTPDRPGATDDGGPTDGMDRGGAGDGSDPTVEFSSVSRSYTTLRGADERVLDGLSTTFASGDRVALVGGNGAGKSTLLELVTGVETPDAGTVTVGGVDTDSTLPERLAEEVVYVHQNPEEMFVEDSVRADVAHYLHARDLEDVDARVDEVVSFLGLAHLEDRDGRLLSVGQQRRASLAIGLATDPSIVLLDEPTGSLDLSSRVDVGRTVEKAGERVETVVVATHDLELAAEWANRVLVLDDGQVVADGPPREVFAATDVLARANLEPPQIVRLSRDLGMSPVALTSDELVERLSAGGSRASKDGSEGELES
jgi:energy-coupling factor transport system ATP-binding protein